MGWWDEEIRIDLQNRLRSLFITFLPTTEQSDLIHLWKLSHLWNAQSSERQWSVSSFGLAVHSRDSKTGEFILCKQMLSVSSVLLPPCLHISSHLQLKNWRATITFKDVPQTVRGRVKPVPSSLTCKPLLQPEWWLPHNNWMKQEL